MSDLQEACIDPYEAFLRDKIGFAPSSGFPCSLDEIHPILLPHQRAVVQWAVEGGRRALFESYGLGKTVQQLEIVRLILAKSRGCRGLIICPLGVRQEFQRDAQMLNIYVRFIRKSHEVGATGIYLTNYESIRDGKLDPNLFDVASLDEASVLRSYGSLTYQRFLTLFEQVKYRFVATATPSPNKFKELIHYAAYLGIMDSGQSLTRWFQRDSTQANNLTLYPHKEQEFWMWLNSWACFLQKPSDLGFSDEGYDLPPLDIRYHELDSKRITGNSETNGQGTMMLDAAVGLRDAAAEKRGSIEDRIAKMVEIVHAAPPDTHFIIWHTLEAERHAIQQALPDVVSVYGTQDMEEREKAIMDFSNGHVRILSVKPEIAGSGCNFQRHCHRAIFLGVDYKANDLMQSVHRIQRFQQPHPCRIDIIHTETEREILKTTLQKWENHKHMTETMTDIIKEHGLNSLSLRDVLARSIGVERIEVTGKSFTVANNDAVLESRRMAENSVDLIVTSIPFANHYEYTPCFDEQTEVLTRRGWISFKELSKQDDVATVNQCSLQLEWQSPSEVIWRPYSGPMYHFHGRNSFDLMVTPDHKMFFDTRVGNRKTGRKVRRFELVSASEAASAFAHRKWRMVSTVQPSGGVHPEFIEIPSCQQRFMPHSRNIESIPIEDFMKLAGWYLSEGCITPLIPDKRGRISISQTDVHPVHREEIIELLERIGLPANTNHRSNISTWSIPIANFLAENFGVGSYSLRIPRWVKDLSPELLIILRDTMMKGDGNSNGFAYTSYSKQLCDDFQEVCLMTGWRASVRGNVVRIGQRNTFPEIRNKPEICEYTGMIGCATVPNHTLIVRRNGHAAVSGNSYNDFGHTDNNGHFWKQMDFLTPELKRVLQPGRLACIHVKDRILFGNTTGEGVPTVSPFHAEAIFHYVRHGFQFLGMITIVTDVVRENNQTYRLGWTENSKDGSKMGVGSPEYVLLFRKPQSDKSKAYADIPVTKSKSDYTRARWQVDAHAFWRSSGNRQITAQEMAGYGTAKLAKVFTDFSLETIYDYEFHVKVGEELELMGALPSSFMSLAPGSHDPNVWHDINRMITLNSAQSAKGREMHLCPLQVDIVERLIHRYSMPGELVHDPFAGLGTVPLCAIKSGRRGSGSELNTAYFLDSLIYLQAAEDEMNTPSLFDFEEELLSA